MPASRRIGRPRPPGGKPLKLCPELVPKPLWGVSAFRLLKRGAAWKRIRADTLATAGDGCAICGATPQPAPAPTVRLYCHEVWHYDDRKALATLTGFQMLCTGCNAVAHMGRAAMVGYLDEALAHLARVNRISEAVARTIFDRAMETWRERNRKAWSTAVSAALLTAYPQLQVLMGQDAGLSGPGTRKGE